MEKMKHCYFNLTLFLILFMAVININAQTKDYDYKLGLKVGNMFHSTEFKLKDGMVISPLAKAFGRLEINEYLEGEAGIGIGLLKGKDFTKKEWETRIIPVDFKLLFAPLKNSGWNPYAYAGIGLINFDNTQKPRVKSIKNTKDNGLAVYIPFGLGAEIVLSDNFLFDISAGYNQSFTDNINLYNNLGYYTELKDITSFDGFFDISAGITYVSTGSSDSDKDGLSKKDEKAIGTDPENSDTDGDGLSDGDEVVKFKTNPHKTDSDDDGLSDFAEVNSLKTNPNKADTDSEGLKDGEEVNKYKTAPLKTDSDSDGLTDYDEVHSHKTNPLKTDTDGDGLSDKEEIQYGTNTLKIDSDGDGLNDADEVNKYKTNPLLIDTDNGSVNDFIEVHRGTDPLNAKDDEILDIKEDKPLVLDGVNFETGKAVITPSSEVILLKALNTMNAYPDLKVEIRGYTDNTGSIRTNNALSQKRADAVRQWLIDRGISSLRITSKGYGPSSPVADNSTAEGRAKNRRIEFYPLRK
ncbi:MAG: OmpA family protein [Ignavibacteria bacterium]|nr:OmpA family protein [Ignavibacteria bacterium]